MSWSMKFADIWNTSQDDFYILFHNQVLSDSLFSLFEQYTVKHFNFAGTIFRELWMTDIFTRIKFRELKILSWSNKSAEFWTHIHALI